MSRIPTEVLAVSREIFEEDGDRERALSAKCKWEQMSRSAVLMQWPSLAEKDEKRIEMAMGGGKG